MTSNASSNDETALHAPTAPGTTGAVRPLVSVVIACFNAERTLGETLASVAAQTLGDLEVFVVDDGSSDASRDIASRWAVADSRFHLVTMPRNGGPSLARRAGVERSAAPYVAFLDADDLWTPEHLAHHVAALRANEGLGVSFSPCAYIDDAGRPSGAGSRVHDGAVVAAELLSSNPTTTCSSLVVRRAVLDEVGHFRSDMTHAEDQEWLFRVVRAGWEVRGIKARTVAYRRSHTGLSADTTRMERGWRQFVDIARAGAPDVVAPALPGATAAMHFYWARQCAAAGSRRQVQRHLVEGLRASPSSALGAPGTAMFLAGASLSPFLAMRVADLARSASRG